MDKFEYKVISVDLPEGNFSFSRNLSQWQQQLSTLGKDGWELVSTIPSPGGDITTSAIIATFKRRI